MKSNAIDALAESLRRGEIPDAQPWDLASAVRRITEGFGRPSEPVSVYEARAAAQILNDCLHYDHTRALAIAWKKSGSFDATVTRHHAQALIDLTALNEAEQLLKDGLAAIEKPGVDAQAASELPKYEGLLGRIYKQRFVNTGDPGFIDQSAEWYRRTYDRKPEFWHGINLVALGALGPAKEAEVAALAEAVLADVIWRVKTGNFDQWALATASEACLALGRCEEAELWLYRFLHSGKLKPFDMESYGRQLREIWQGDPTTNVKCADRLAGIISRHVARTQRRVTIPASAVASMNARLETDRNGFEKNFTGEGTFSVDAIDRLLKACTSIGCVCKGLERLGTGFVVKGSALKASYGDGPVFITNAHVISADVAGAIRPNEAQVTFEVQCSTLRKAIFYRVEKVLFTSNPGSLGKRNPDDDDLDVTIVQLEPAANDLCALNVADSLPVPRPKSKAFVAGHPRGSGLQISLNDSLLLDIDQEQRLVHYRTPTDPGNSGSPVFNSDWEVIAIHHGGSAETPRLNGSGEYEANEGIALAAVKRRLARV